MIQSGWRACGGKGVTGVQNAVPAWGYGGQPNCPPQVLDVKLVQVHEDIKCFSSSQKASSPVSTSTMPSLPVPSDPGDGEKWVYLLSTEKCFTNFVWEKFVKQLYKRANGQHGERVGRKVLGLIPGPCSPNVCICFLQVTWRTSKCLESSGYVL